ncbi:MAG: C40 family peptidase [Pseudomonadota bacterium]
MRILILATALVLTANLHAEPATASDSASFFYQLGDQFSQARQTLGDHASDLVAGAMGFLGVPYKRGGTSVETGFDCSGFVRAMYERSIGLLLPRRAEQQAAATQQISATDLRPGDLVFFNTMRRAFSHVGIYVGDGQFIHSPASGGVVRVEDMRQAYWEKRFDGARRVRTALPELPAAITPGVR